MLYGIPTTQARRKRKPVQLTSSNIPIKISQMKLLIGGSNYNFIPEPKGCNHTCYKIELPKPRFQNFTQ